MAIYTMAQVEALTGIKAPTLRKWEERYSFLYPERSATNIRFYSDDQLRKLLNISILVRNGYRISKLDKMSDDRIHELVAEHMMGEETAYDDEISALTAAMVEMNESAFYQVFNRQVTRVGLLSTITDLIYPFLQHLGVLWGINKSVPAQEHFISNLIRQKIISAIDATPMPSEKAPSIVLFLPEKESHEIGLLLAAYIAKDMGWRVYYLGQNVPLENLTDVFGLAQPKAIMTMIITPNFKKNRASLKYLTDITEVPLLISGNLTAVVDVLPAQAKVLRHPIELINFLNAV